MNKNEMFGIAAKEYLLKNGYGLQLHDIEKLAEEKFILKHDAICRLYPNICNFQTGYSDKYCALVEDCKYKHITNS